MNQQGRDDEREALVAALRVGERESRAKGGSAIGLFEAQADALIAAGYRKHPVREVDAAPVWFVADPAQITALNPLGIVAVGEVEQ